LIILLLLGCSLARAATDLSEPQLIVKEAAEKLQAAMKENPPAGNYEHASGIVTEILDPHVDFVRISALVLAKHWKRATRDQKIRFIKEFKALMVRTYAVAFSEYSDWEIKYLPIKMTPNDDKVFVKTQVLRPGAPPIEVSYRMIHRKGAWKVFDVVIEGISFVSNYRSTFKNDIARTGSLEGVIERLTTHNNKN
jgi:phospholipid transport system substrate-binding protein